MKKIFYFPGKFINTASKWDPIFVEMIIIFSTIAGFPYIKNSVKSGGNTKIQAILD